MFKFGKLGNSSTSAASLLQQQQQQQQQQGGRDVAHCNPVRLYHAAARRDDSSSSSASQSTNTTGDDQISLQSFGEVNTTFQSNLDGVGIAIDDLSMIYSEGDDDQSATSGGGINHYNTNDNYCSSNSSVMSGVSALTQQSAGSSTADGGSSRGRYQHEQQLLYPLDTDDRSLLSNGSSLFSDNGDKYFQPLAPEEEPEEDDYIFTDDEQEASPFKYVDCLTADESAALEHELFTVLPAVVSMDEDDLQGKDAILSPGTWTEYNTARGRMVAQALLQKMRSSNSDSIVSSTASSSADDDDDHDNNDNDNPEAQKQQTRRRRRPTTRHRRTFLGRAVQSLRNSGSRNSNNKRYTVVSSALDSVKSPSAVHARNALVDFGSWEARVVHKKSNKPPVAPTPQQVVTPPGSPVIEQDVAIAAAATAATTAETSKELPFPNFALRAVLGLQAATTDEDHDDDNQEHQHLADSFSDELLQALEVRNDAYTVLQALGLGTEAVQCLQTVRNRAGVVDDLQADTGQDGDCTATVLPWMHVTANVWMPHYEEYVMQTVNAFHRRMVASSAL